MSLSFRSNSEKKSKENEDQNLKKSSCSNLQTLLEQIADLNEKRRLFAQSKELGKAGKTIQRIQELERHFKKESLDYILRQQD